MSNIYYRFVLMSNPRDVLKKDGIKGPVGNYLVLHPDGTKMFYCNKKKAIWFIERELAEWVVDKTLKLTFIPKGKGFDDDDEFGLTPRIFRCVVCGVDEEIQRHHIVPYCYRKFMDKIYKSKNYHDVVLICKFHHYMYEHKAVHLKNEFAKEYGVLTLAESCRQFSEKFKNQYGNEKKACGIVNGLIRNSKRLHNQMPHEKFLEYINKIEELLNIKIEDQSVENLENIHFGLRVDLKKATRDLQENSELMHGREIVKKISGTIEMNKFIKKWRRYFIETTKPNHMPAGWSVDRKINIRL